MYFNYWFKLIILFIFYLRVFTYLSLFHIIYVNIHYSKWFSVLSWSLYFIYVKTNSGMLLDWKDELSPGDLSHCSRAAWTHGLQLDCCSSLDERGIMVDELFNVPINKQQIYIANVILVITYLRTLFFVYFQNSIKTWNNTKKRNHIVK